MADDGLDIIFGHVAFLIVFTTFLWLDHVFGHVAFFGHQLACTTIDLGTNLLAHSGTNFATTHCATWLIITTGVMPSTAVGTFHCTMDCATWL